MLPPDSAAVSPQEATAWPSDLDPWDNAAVSAWLVDGGWLHWELDVRDAPRRPGTWNWRRTRMLDVGVTLIVAPVALILVGVAALAVLLTMGRPVFFRQNRPGFLCRPFEMWKLRTMRTVGDSESPRQDARRLTRVGRFLRRTSIDELPQFWNVLCGEMSLVGPRPQLMAYLPRMDALEVRRHLVLPGITGESQVAGRNAVRWEERFHADLEYVRSTGTMRDLWILARTVPAVLSTRDVSAESRASMEEMAGSTLVEPREAGS